MGYILTAIDIAAIKQATRALVSFNDGHSTMRGQGVTLIHEQRKSEKTPFPSDQEYQLVDCPVNVQGYYKDTSKGLLAFGHLQFYANSPVATIMRSLKVNDEIEFSFYPDCHTNGYVSAAGLHADALMLYVYRGEGKNRKRLEYEVDHCIAPNNQGRMIRGLVEGRSYREDGARVRKEWTPPVTIYVESNAA